MHVLSSDDILLIVPVHMCTSLTDNHGKLHFVLKQYAISEKLHLLSADILSRTLYISTLLLPLQRKLYASSVPVR